MNTALCASTVLVPLTAGIAFLINREVPEPYIDEIFHIPQAQQYCQGEFHKWDPSLTTPPGLYIFSTALSWAFRRPCTPALLRLTNILLSTTLLPWSINGIIRSTTRTTRIPDVLVISTFPLITFFSQLYYTDTGSLTFVLAGYWAARERVYGLSALVGLVSLTFRQTNVVWIAFTAATAILSEYDAAPKPLLKISSPYDLVTELVQTPRRIINQPRRALEIFSWYLPTFAAFGVFIIWNGGIVLGHQEMHVATLHFPQLLYFLAFATVMGWPVLLEKGVERAVRGTIATGLGSRWKIACSLIVLGMMNLFVRKYTIEHPFLLADNRHYFFYIWRRVFKLHPFVPYALTPGYLICGLAWLWKIGRTQGLYWIIGFVACTTAVLVPTPLVEPRYFLIPYLFLRIHCLPIARQSGSATQSRNAKGPADGVRSRWVWVELVWNAFVNVVTIGLFLNVTFDWEGWEGKMRFMW
ncbi:glucosyltransferase [Naganishia albida]|nr:glucosyltransferase [Naganishia albida]